MKLGPFRCSIDADLIGLGLLVYFPPDDGSPERPVWDAYLFLGPINFTVSFVRVRL